MKRKTDDEETVVPGWGLSRSRTAKSVATASQVIMTHHMHQLQRQTAYPCGVSCAIKDECKCDCDHTNNEDWHAYAYELKGGIRVTEQREAIQ